MIPAFLYPCFLCETPNDFKVSTEPASLVFTPDSLVLDLEPSISVTAGSVLFTGAAVDLLDSTVDVVSLTGTAGSPIAISGFGKYPGGSSKAYLRANTSGALEKATTTIGSGGVLGSYTQIGTDWVSPLTTYSGSYWIRATKVSGDNLVSGTLGSWLALTTTREWKQEALGSTYTGDYAETLLKLEISTDVSGSPIVATGHYRLIADWQSLA